MILENFIPELCKIIQYNEYSCFLTTERVIGSIFDVELIDLEENKFPYKFHTLQKIFNLPCGIILRVFLKNYTGKKISSNLIRSEALKEICFSRKRIFFSFEKRLTDYFSILQWIKKETLLQNISSFFSSLPLEELKELGAQSLNSQQIQAFFDLPLQEISKKIGILDFGTHLISVIRMHLPGNNQLNEKSLAQAIDRLSLPYEIHVSLKKQNALKTQWKSKNLIQFQKEGTEIENLVKIKETQEVLSQTNLHGSAIIFVEWLLILKNLSEREMREQAAQALSILRDFGEVSLETVGAYNSYRATLLGNEPHYGFEELSTQIFAYLPIFTFGEKKDHSLLCNMSKRVTPFHRLDGSLTYFDPFSEKYHAYNILITGKTGSGKSVLGNLLSASLLSDENIFLRKIDVGGSYKNECEEWKGKEITFDLNEPSGVNPFKLIDQHSHLNPDELAILSEFLANLIREKGETYLSKELYAKIEFFLLNYFNTFNEKKENFSLQNFIKFSPKFPRLNLLRRWGEEGIFKNALKENQNYHKDTPRYIYYNFKNIQGACQKDYVQGIMSAVIAEVNLCMIHLSKKKGKNSLRKRLVLFCDETKFFIENNASFFLLTTANFRKFGHSVILLGQNIKDFELKFPDGSQDLGIVLNSPTRFYFPTTLEKEYLTNLLHLPEEYASFLLDNNYSSLFRQAVLQDEQGCRMIRIFLSKKESILFSSRKEDREKIEFLRANIPGLTLNEAIKCLTNFRDKIDISGIKN